MKPSEAPGAKVREVIERLRQAREAACENPQEVTKRQKGTKKKVDDTVASTIETEPEKRLSFAEAAKFLEGKLDLGAARTDAIKSHSRWGLVDALIKTGAIKRAYEYPALFDQVTISEAGLTEVRRSLELGRAMMPIFDAGKMTPEQLFATLYQEIGTALDNPRMYEGLRSLRRIDPSDIPDLQNFQEKFWLIQQQAFQKAYEKARPLKMMGPRLIFTPDELEVSRLGISAAEDIQTLAKGGIDFLDPNADFIRYRTQMDAGFRRLLGPKRFDELSDVDYSNFLKTVFDDETYMPDPEKGTPGKVILSVPLVYEYMPDRKKATHYPNYIFSNGTVATLAFVSEGCVEVRPQVPGQRANREYIGSRIMLG